MPSRVYRHSDKKKSPQRVFFLYIMIFLFTGIQSNLEIDIWGNSFNINLLLLLTSFLVVYFEWTKVAWYCLLIGLIMDVFSSAQPCIATISLWFSALFIIKIKLGFYIEYISTNIFLLLLLITIYSFIFTMCNYITQEVDILIKPFTQMVIYNSTLTLFIVPILNPLLRGLLYGKK